MEDGIDRSMMETHQEYARMLQNKRLFVHISQEKYILTDDVKRALEFSIKNKCAVDWTQILFGRLFLFW